MEKREIIREMSNIVCQMMKSALEKNKTGPEDKVLR